jgi:hypothetical protein
MIFPSITTLSFGVAVLATLAIIVWYVSRRTPVLPYLLPPSGTREPMRKAIRRISRRSSSGPRRRGESRHRLGP